MEEKRPDSDDDWEVVEGDVEKQSLAQDSTVQDESCPDDDVFVVVKKNDNDGEAGPENWFRKTSVAVAGGTMVGVGLVMIPLPTPFGAVIAASGMSVLGTEFPAAQRVLQGTCNKVADAIENNLKNEENKEKEDAVVSMQHANDTMVEIMQDNKQKQDAPIIQRNLNNLGKKAAPVIRKIGAGIDREQLDRASRNVTKTASDATFVVQTQASRLWRHVMVLDEDEDLMTPFKWNASPKLKEEEGIE